MPALLFLLLFAVDFGRLFFSYVAVNNAAREASYYAATHAADTPFDLAAYRAGIDGAAVREANVQGQGGEGTLTVSEPTCFTPSATTAGLPRGIGFRRRDRQPGHGVGQPAIHLPDAAHQ